MRVRIVLPGKVTGFYQLNTANAPLAGEIFHFEPKFFSHDFADQVALEQDYLVSKVSQFPFHGRGQQVAVIHLSPLDGGA